jgi:hypothetical protein
MIRNNNGPTYNTKHNRIKLITALRDRVSKRKS